MKSLLVLALGATAALSSAQTTLPAGYVDQLIKDLAGDIPKMELAWPHHTQNGSVESAVSMFSLFGEKAVPVMVPLLDSKEYWQVVIAALTLAKLGDRSQIQKLTLMSQDSGEPGIRQIAIRALGQLKAKEAVDALIEVVRREDTAYVVSTAVIALGEIGDARAIPVLVANLGRHVESDLGADYTSWVEIDALAKFGEPAIVVLEPLLASEDKAKANSALRAIGQIKSIKSRQIVLRALDNPDQSETAVNIFMTAKEQYDGDVLVKVLDRLSVRDQAWAVEILHNHKDPRAADMARIVWSRIYTQLVAGEATGYDLILVTENIKRVGYKPPAKEMIDAIGRSSDLRVIHDAFDLLSLEEIDAGASVIVARLTDWDSDNYYGEDIESLADTISKAGPAGGTVAIALVLAGKGTDEFKLAALTRMVRVEHVDLLREVLRGKDRELALYAALGLASLGKPEAAASLREFAKSKDEMTAARALSALVKMGDRWGRGEYIDRFASYYYDYSAVESRPYSQFLIVREYEVGLRSLDESGRELLASGIRRKYSENEVAFLKAVYWLLGNTGSWAAAMHASQDPEVKSLALIGGRQSDEADLAARYRKLLFDKDPGLRFQAYRFLKERGEFDPPKARS